MIDIFPFLDNTLYYTYPGRMWIRWGFGTTSLAVNEFEQPTSQSAINHHIASLCVREIDLRSYKP